MWWGRFSQSASRVWDKIWGWWDEDREIWFIRMLLIYIVMCRRCQKNMYASNDNEHSTLPVLLSDVYWSGWQNLTKRFRRLIYHRQLLINNGTDYVAEEYSRISTGVQYIVANSSLPDSVFTASSYWGNGNGQSPKRARIDNYFTGACAWAARYKIFDFGPWLKITLPGQYEVIGVYIRQRYDIVQYPTVVNVTTSVDDVLWQDVVIGEDIANRYSDYYTQGSVSLWFPRSYATRYWNIYILKYVSHPSMKCDLIGYAISNTIFEMYMFTRNFNKYQIIIKWFKI